MQAGELSVFGFPLPRVIGVILGVLLILGCIISLMIKRLHDSPNRIFAHAATKPPKKPVFAGKPEIPRDVRVPQKTGPFAGYEVTQLQSNINNPGTSPRQVSLSVSPPGKNITEPTWAVPQAEDTGTAIPYSGPPVPRGNNAEDTAEDTIPGSLIKNPGTSPRPAYLPVAPPDKKITALAEAMPHSEDTGIPAPHFRPPAFWGKDTEHRDPADPINRSGPRKISLMTLSSRKKDIKPYHGPLMLSLFVEDQNTNIGRRNVHTVKSGYSFTIGGGNSDFLIFLVPIPPRIAELRSDGAQCTLIPRRPEFFPDIGSQQVTDCIGKPIRILSERRYELIIRIDRYEDPLITLNRLLHSVDVPGYPQEPA
jgi:hypothetical protein